MNPQEVKSAINDFRVAFAEDLGSQFFYGKRTLVKPTDGFYIDKKTETTDWVGKTPETQRSLYCTSKTATVEEIEKAGLNKRCTGIVTCIYEDILELQPLNDQGVRTLKRDNILKDNLMVVFNGVEETYQILDYTFAFQLRDTYIFIKFGVVSLDLK